MKIPTRVHRTLATVNMQELIRFQLEALTVQLKIVITHTYLSLTNLDIALIVTDICLNSPCNQIPNDFYLTWNSLLCLNWKRNRKCWLTSILLLLCFFEPLLCLLSTKSIDHYFIKIILNLRSCLFFPMKWTGVFALMA